jgi:hypothetical protein
MQQQQNMMALVNMMSQNKSQNNPGIMSTLLGSNPNYQQRHQSNQLKQM